MEKIISDIILKITIILLVRLVNIVKNNYHIISGFSTFLLNIYIFLICWYILLKGEILVGLVKKNWFSKTIIIYILTNNFYNILNKLHIGQNLLSHTKKNYKW
jgi:hypothetical protein